VPLVVHDVSFDQRLHVGMGPEFLPAVERLSPELLGQTLAQLSDPSQHVDKLHVQCWRGHWWSFLT